MQNHKNKPVVPHHADRKGVSTQIRGVPVGYLNDRFNRQDRQIDAVGFTDPRWDDGALHLVTWAKRK